MVKTTNAYERHLSVRAHLRKSGSLLLILLASLLGPSLFGQAGDSLSQYQSAVQTRMDDLVRHAVHEFFAQARLPEPRITRVVATSLFDFSHGEDQVRIASLDLDVVLRTEHPAEVVRQLRLYVNQELSREGFDVSRFATVSGVAPRLTLTLDVQPPQSPAFQFYPRHWRQYVVFSLLIIAFLLSIGFAGILIWIPLRRALRVRSLDLPMETGTDAEREQNEATLLSEPDVTEPDVTLPEPPSRSGAVFAKEILPPLPPEEALPSQPVDTDPGVSFEGDSPEDQEPSYLGRQGARRTNVTMVRQMLAALPLEDAIDMLSCLDDQERQFILQELNLNGSVRDHIQREIKRQTETQT